jgi:uncharacterized protein (TIGR02646 family)
LIYIKKTAEPPSLAVRREMGSLDWNVTGEVKNDIRRACRIEQSELCAFCCARLSADPELQRIAHVVPRAVDPARTLDFTNMVLSCSSGRNRLVDAVVAPLAKCCDEKQGANPLPISPLQPDCQGRFAYDRSGRIFPSEDGNGAEETIIILNLDCDRLRETRKRVIQGVETLRERLGTEKWNRIYRDPTPPHLPDFWPAIASQRWPE